MPQSFPPRAWLVAERPTLAGWRVLPLRAPEVRLSVALFVLPPVNRSPAQARFALEGDAWFAELPGRPRRAPLVHGETVECDGVSLRFEQRSALEVLQPPLELEERPDDAAAWRRWADALLAQGDPLAGWLLAPSRADLSLSAQLGALAPLVERGLASVQWNAFGFLDVLQLPARTLSAHPFCADAALVPAARFLQRLELTAQLRGDVVTWPLRGEAPLPRSLRALALELPDPEVPFEDADLLLAEVRARCPFLRTTEETLWLPR